MDSKPEREQGVFDRSSLPLALSNIAVNLGSPFPIYAQICSAIRTAIIARDLPPGTMMPTGRDLAIALGVGRNTVVSAYSQLVAERYLEANLRRGTRVAERPVGTPNASGADSAPLGILVPATDDSALEISHSAKRLLEPLSPSGPANGPFAMYAVDPALYPRILLSRLLTDEFARAPSDDAGYDDSSELQRFQAAVAAHVRQSQGVICEPAQIFPMLDAAAAIDVTTRLFIDAGNAVQIEDPSWDLPRIIFQSAGARLFPMPSDKSGANPKLVAAPPPRLMFVSPSVSFAYGIQMPIARRQEIVDHARASGALIFEFDPDGELLFTGGKQRTIQSMDPGRVIYYGCTRKTLGPKIRVGYLVVPQRFVDSMTKIVRIASVTPEHFMLSALATATQEGKYALHLKKIRSVYAQRMARFVELCRAQIPDAAITEPSGGLHLTLQFPQSVPEKAICDAAAKQGLSVAPLSQFYIGNVRENGIVLGIGSCPDQQLDGLAHRLASCVRDARNATRAALSDVSALRHAG
jgi:GntR family transcriptional regulator / MocR family aminotransferase